MSHFRANGFSRATRRPTIRLIRTARIRRRPGKRMRMSKPAAALLLAAVGLTIALYARGLDGPFLFDDSVHITQNRWVKIDSLAWPDLVRAWNSSFSGFPGNRPLAQLTFGINHAFAGLDPRAFKTTNLVIHLVNGLLVFLFTRLALGAVKPRQARDLTALSAAVVATAAGREALGCWPPTEEPLDVIAKALEDRDFEVIRIPYRVPCMVGGSFRSVGTMGTSNLAILGDEGWTPFEVGPRGVVNSACEYQGELYVAGDFDFVGDRGAYNIARWDGDVWDTVGAGLRGEERYDHVAGLLNYRGDLIAYGNFYSVRSRNVPSVAAWNGGEWRSLGDPPWPLRGTQIDAGTVWDDHLVLSIWDTENSDRYIAIFDGRQWSRLDEIPIRACYALSTYRGQLLISALLDDVFDNILWLWDGSALSILGDGIRGDRIDGMMSLEDDLYLGGTFTYAGNQPSRNFAVHDGSTLPSPSRSSTIKVSPNPMWNETTITFSTSERRNVGVRVFDSQGRLCRTLRDDLPLDSGIHWMMWRGQDEDDRPAPAGVYFVRVDAGPDTRTEKVLVLR